MGITLPVEAAPAIHEFVNTNGDGDSNSIYGGEFSAIIFESEATAHSVSSIYLALKRVGSPGYVKVSLRNVAAGVPTGGDLTSALLDGDTFSTSYKLYEFNV